MRMDLFIGATLLLIILASYTDAQNADLVIKPTGEQQTRALKESIVFTCTAEDLSREVDPHLKWYDQEGRPIEDTTGRLYVEEDGKQSIKLYITSIVETDAGTYSCKGELEGNNVEVSVKLLLYKDITFDHAPTPQNPEIYKDEIIECRVSGQPVPTVTWRYKGSKLETGIKYTYLPEGLQVKNITESDNGIYVCRAEVQVDGRVKDVQIDVVVHIPPKMTQHLGTSEGIENEEHSMTCKASGKPEPKYRFFKGSSQSEMFSNDRIEVDGDSGSVNFRPLNRIDADSYRCQAVNDVGNDESEGELMVIIPPRIIGYDNVTQTEGGTAKLTCRSEGVPDPQMYFVKVKDGIRFDEGVHEGGRIDVRKLDGTALEITVANLSPADTSNYTCHAINEAGEFEKNGTITVHYPPRFDPEHPTAVYSWSGKTKNMTCNPLGEPAPQVDWYRYDVEKLYENETFKIYHLPRQGVLQITIREGDQNWIYGEYQCRAINKYGTEDLVMMLDMATVPDKPKDVSIQESSPTMVIFTVLPPDNDGGMEIYAYRVEYENIVQDFFLDQEILIENLKAATTYIFRFRAKNEVGVGDYFEKAHTTEKIREPFAIEISSEPEGPYPYHYVLRWEKPKTGGLPIKEYEFRIQQVEVEEGSWKITKVLEDFTNIRVLDDPKEPMLYYDYENLKPDTYYNTHVIAFNDIGESPPNPDFVFRTAEDPSYVPVIGSGTTASISYLLLSFVSMATAVFTRF